MTDTSPRPTPRTPPELGDLTPLLTALSAAAAAWVLFDPKLERIRTMWNESGRHEGGFRGFYVIPQWTLMILSVVTVAFMLAAFLDTFQPHLLPQFFPIAALREFLRFENLVWILLIVAVLAVVIRWNWLPRALLLAGRAVSYLPIPGLLGRFGPEGTSAGWHQAKAVCEGPDKGAPLLVHMEDIDRVAQIVLGRISVNAGKADFAEKPAGVSQAAMANMALFGCIMEANIDINRWGRPKWAKFYRAFETIERATPMFEPRELLKFQNGGDFFEAFRDRLDKELRRIRQPRPDSRSLAAATDISKAWTLLRDKAEGDVLRLAPKPVRFLRLTTFCLNWRLRRFPRLSDHGMRPQLIKLLIRWDCIEPGRGLFNQPFSKSIAWLLLQEGALRALPETKEVTFHSFGHTAVSRLAMKRVNARVAELITAEGSVEARTVAALVGNSAWKRYEIGDFGLWSWANEASKTAKADGWDKAIWKWKQEAGRVLRQS